VGGEGPLRYKRILRGAVFGRNHASVLRSALQCSINGTHGM
jgi:hypothetical protein